MIWSTSLLHSKRFLKVKGAISELLAASQETSNVFDQI